MEVVAQLDHLFVEKVAVLGVAAPGLVGVRNDDPALLEGGLVRGHEPVEVRLLLADQIGRTHELEEPRRAAVGHDHAEQARRAVLRCASDIDVRRERPADGKGGIWELILLDGV